MLVTNYATLDDLTTLVRPLDPSETGKASLLLEAASASLRAEASRRNKDFDAMLAEDPDLVPIARDVVCSMVRRALAVDANAQAMSQVSQSAMGYSVSGTFAVPGGSLYALNSELRRLGLRRQVATVLEPFGGEATC